jgi:hypothetical protein
LFVSVEDGAVRSVADGVGANLKASLESPACHAVNLGFRSGHDALGLRSVAIRFEKRGAARAERTIGKKLECANGQLVMCIDFRPALEPLFDEILVRAIEHGINAQGHLPVPY